MATITPSTSSFSGSTTLGPLTGGIAGMGGDFVSGALGIRPNILGTAGGLVGSAFGPVGSFAGSVLGNTVGKIFGLGKKKKPKRPYVDYIYDFNTGNPFLSGSKVYGDEGLDAYRGLTDYIGDTSMSLLSRLGLAPSVDRFGFGSWQGRTGFALDTDPFVIDKTSPGSVNAIKSNVYGPNMDQAISMGRIFGDLGKRQSAPDDQLINQASMAAINALVGDPILAAGLTNRQVFEKMGLPTEMDALKSAIPGLAIGDDFGFDNPFSFKATDLMSYGPPQQISGPMSTPEALSGPALNLYNTYQTMAPQLGAPNQGIPSYYRRG